MPDSSKPVCDYGNLQKSNVQAYFLFLPTTNFLSLGIKWLSLYRIRAKYNRKVKDMMEADEYYKQVIHNTGMFEGTTCQAPWCDFKFETSVDIHPVMDLAIKKRFLMCEECAQVVKQDNVRFLVNKIIDEMDVMRSI